MHLAVLAEIAAIGIEDRGGIMVKPLGPLLEQRGHDHHSQLVRQPAELLG